MSAREVAMRVARAVRERVQPLPKEPPDATWRRHYAAHAPLPTVHRIADTLAPRPQTVSSAERERLLQEGGRPAGAARGRCLATPCNWTTRPAGRRNYLLGKDWAGRPREGD
jgi:hypothetical protein